MPATNNAVKQEVKNYTRTPNILFEDYPQLHPQEKWLYINLTYLCGSRGTRYLSLRFISKNTGISVGALSGDKKKGNAGMIRNLHNAGLIHAELKKQNGEGQTQYHITITDIWQMNIEFFQSRKCSEYEHLDSESVQNTNASVQIMNTIEVERSENEQKRSENETISNTSSKTEDISKTTSKIIEPPKPPTKPARTERPNVTVIKPQLTLEGQAVIGWYEQIRGRKQRLTDKNIAAANNLGMIDGMTLENLKAVIETLDKTPFVLEKNLTVDLVNLERENYYYNFEKTLAIVERNRKNTRTSAPTGKPKRTPEEERRYQLFMQAQDGMKRTGTGGK